MTATPPPKNTTPEAHATEGQVPSLPSRTVVSAAQVGVRVWGQSDAHAGGARADAIDFRSVR